MNNMFFIMGYPCHEKHQHAHIIVIKNKTEDRLSPISSILFILLPIFFVSSLSTQQYLNLSSSSELGDSDKPQISQPNYVISYVVGYS